MRQYASDEPLSQRTSLSDSDKLRQCDTVCDSGNFGTFTISYDAPSPRSRRDTHSLSHDENEEDLKLLPNGSELCSSDKARESLHSNANSFNSKQRNAPSVETGGLKKLPQPLAVATRSSGKALTGIAVARSVGDVARASRVNSTAPLPRASKKGHQTPPHGSQSSWSCWRQESDVSDVVSEAGVTSGINEQKRRSGPPRSAPSLTTRSNRTFALRCAAKKRAEATASPTSSTASSSVKPARSRSAENNARLALAARSGSGSRAQSQKQEQNAPWRTRRESGDSSTSLSSNLSIATHDGSYFRRDGGRYSMRVEKSNTTSCLSAAAKRLQVVNKSKTGSSQPRAKQSAGTTSITESKEMTAWKRRKEYDPRKSVAKALAERGKSIQCNQRSSASPDTGRHDTGLGTVDEIAKLSNAVAYNLSVLSDSSQTDAVTLVSYELQIICMLSFFILAASYASAPVCGCLGSFILIIFFIAFIMFHFFIYIHLCAYRCFLL